jgi:hypothetical protein
MCEIKSYDFVNFTVINRYYVIYSINKIGALDDMREGKNWCGNFNVEF